MSGDTCDDIMAATYRALCEHGYAAVTTQDIADEASVSTAALHYHYDGKDDLLVDFLEFLLERFERVHDLRSGATADERLANLFDSVLGDADAGRSDFLAVMVELRAQAAHDEAYREHFDRSDRLIRERIAAIVRAGVGDGTFRDVDPDAVATFLKTTLDGAMVAAATTDRADHEAVRAELDAYVRDRLLAPGAD